MLFRYLRTLRYLRLEQITGQIRHRIRRIIERPERWSAGEAPTPVAARVGSLGEIGAPAPGPEVASVLGGEFRFAGEERTAGWPPKWNCPDASMLWQYNLHYHDWLWPLVETGRFAKALEGAVAWIESHPLRRGAVGWEPYPTSLRLQNWLLLFFCGEGVDAIDSETRNLLWKSLWKQARWLEKHLERHLLGNHLLENAATLSLLGAVFPSEDGQRWQELGFALLRRELAEQFLADGMHFELSPMYHVRASWVLALLAATGDERLSSLVEAPLGKAKAALSLLCHPDGEIALFNDSGLGIYRPPGGSNEQVEPGAWSLPAAGYYGYRSKEGDYLVCDAARLGPDYLPGHAHADCLSFELSVGGRRVITDTGVSDYRDSEARRMIRSTGAHNTVEIDGRDQAEMWGAFRVGARGRPERVVWEPREDGLRLAAGHTGYARGPLMVRHRRRFALQGRCLEISDWVSGKGSFDAVARLHFAPECEVREAGRGVQVSWPGGEMNVEMEGAGRARLGSSAYFENFGEKRERTVLEYRVKVEQESQWGISLRW